ANAGWSQLTPANAPAARERPAMIYDPNRGAVLLFGGADAAGNPLGDMWTWDGTTWTQFVGAVPPARTGAGISYDAHAHKVVLFGGGAHAGAAALADTWSWNGTTWTQEMPAASPTDGRVSPAMVYDSVRQETLLYGGLVDGAYSGETWALAFSGS